MPESNAVELATELTVAWLSNPSTRASADEVQTFLTSMNDTLGSLTAGSADQQPDAAAQPEYTPAVSVRKSLGSRDHIISMIDGKPYRTLKRHLATNGLTPAEYRSRYNLKADYPMVAPAYSESRRETARRLGLGRKPADAAAVESDVAPVAAEPTPPLAEEAQPTARKPRARKAAAEATTTAAEPASTPSEQVDDAGAAPSKKPRARKSVTEAKAAAK